MCLLKNEQCWLLESKVNKGLQDSRVRPVTGVSAGRYEAEFAGFLIQPWLSRGGYLEEVRSPMVLRNK